MLLRLTVAASEADRCLLAICSLVSGLGEEVRVEDIDEFLREVDILALEAAELSFRCKRKLLDLERISSVKSNMMDVGRDGGRRLFLFKSYSPFYFFTTIILPHKKRPCISADDH